MGGCMGGQAILKFDLAFGDVWLTCKKQFNMFRYTLYKDRDPYFRIQLKTFLVLVLTDSFAQKNMSGFQMVM